MPMTDPIADMLTIIRNANMCSHTKTVMQYSTLKESVAQVLKSEGYISDYKVIADEGSNAKKKSLHIYLKYGQDGEKVLNKITRVSKPGRRIYKGIDNIDKVLDGLGITILSTSKGVMSNRQARKLNIGGEVICKVW